jgi:hypothetical protein
VNQARSHACKSADSRIKRRHPFSDVSYRVGGLVEREFMPDALHTMGAHKQRSSDRPK